jgi:catechol 2,3-dioxygenase-like lactoylglutathione lyase family enzyme
MSFDFRCVAGSARLLAVLLSFVGPSLAFAAPNPPPSIAAFDHVAIYVRDPDISAEFYKSVFGLKQTPAPVPFARWLTMGNGVMLHIVKGRTTPPGHSKWDHIALACADMDEMIQRLADRHIAWSDIEGRKTPQVRADGVKQIFIEDPDGYWIEINDSLKSR